MRRALLVTTLLAFTMTNSFAAAAPCKDAKGKFTKCPAVAKPAKCRDAKGKFMKCAA